MSRKTLRICAAFFTLILLWSGVKIFNINSSNPELTQAQILAAHWFDYVAFSSSIFGIVATARFMNKKECKPTPSGGYVLPPTADAHEVLKALQDVAPGEYTLTFDGNGWAHITKGKEGHAR